MIGFTYCWARKASMSSLWSARSGLAAQTMMISRTLKRATSAATAQMLRLAVL
jgi:hypothetical protein